MLSSSLSQPSSSSSPTSRLRQPTLALHPSSSSPSSSPSPSSSSSSSCSPANNNNDARTRCCQRKHFARQRIAQEDGKTLKRTLAARGSGRVGTRRSMLIMLAVGILAAVALAPITANAQNSVLSSSSSSSPSSSTFSLLPEDADHQHIVSVEDFFISRHYMAASGTKQANFTSSNNEASNSSSSSSNFVRSPKDVFINRRNENASLLYSDFRGTCSASVAYRFNIFCPSQVIDISLRSMATLLSICNTIYFLMLFANRTSFVSIITVITMLGHGVAVFCSLLPYARITPPSIHLTVYANVGLLLFTSETFLWLLYLRFTAVAPMKSRFFKALVLTWMVMESACIFAIWIIWVVGAEKRNDLRALAGQSYSYASIIQAGTALFLSGYFVVFFFFPRLKGLRSLTLFVTFFTSGLVYLIVETGLQIGFTLFFKLDETREFYTGLNQFCTAARHLIFLLFIHAIRDASATAEKEREQRRLARKAAENGGEGFYAKAALAAGISPDNVSTTRTAPSSLHKDDDSIRLPPNSTEKGSTSTTNLLDYHDRSRSRSTVRRASWSSTLTDDTPIQSTSSSSRNNPNPWTMIVGAHTSTSLPRPSSFLTDGGMDDPPPPAVTRGTPNPTRLTLAPPRPSTDSSRSNTSAVSKYPPALYTYKPPSASSSSTPTSPVLAASSASVSSQRSGAGSAAATVVGKRRPTPHLAFQPPVGTEVRGGEVRGVGQKQLETDLSYTKTHIW